ncbi:MAG: hypothetical protein CMJ19_22740 [Phycisphaeraceae bacterium]|nr:hypothetical protein [Phycisphaeraceae bacterium]
MTGCQPQPEQSAEAIDPQRVGVYDSRSIAIAFVNSPAYKQHVQPIHTANHQAYAQAVEDGDTARVEQLKAWGQAQQTKLHMQAFSTEPVDEILKHVQSSLPLIKQQTGVDRLICKWDKQAMAEVGKAQQVDVTLLLIDAFKPTPTQRKAAIEILKHQPIALDAARRIDD